MKNLYINNADDPDFYIKIISTTYHVFGINVNKDYQFVYDEFLNHLKNDTEEFVEKNYLKDKYPNNKMIYKMNIFKKIFSQHMKAWRDKLNRPETFPEYKRKIRTDKLNKIQNDTIYNISI